MLGAAAREGEGVHSDEIPWPSKPFLRVSRMSLRQRQYPQNAASLAGLRPTLTQCRQLGRAFSVAALMSFSCSSKFRIWPRRPIVVRTHLGSPTSLFLPQGSAEAFALRFPARSSYAAQHLPLLSVLPATTREISLPKLWKSRGDCGKSSGAIGVFAECFSNTGAKKASRAGDYLPNTTGPKLTGAWKCRLATN